MLLCDLTDKQSYNLFWNQLGRNANVLRPITVWEKIFTCCFDRLKETYEEVVCYIELRNFLIGLLFVLLQDNMMDISNWKF